MDQVFINEPKYFSDRGIPLVTQHLLTDNDGNPVAMLTVEDYCKWYKMFIIHPDGTVEPRVGVEIPSDPHEYGWIDHAIKPWAFHETAKNLGLVYDNRTFAMVCERFVEDIVDDWTKLAPYLPEEDNSGKR